MSQKSIHARRFFITLNQPEKYEQVKKLLGTFRYLLSCREHAPTTGHLHIHIYVCYASTKRLGNIGADIRTCKGSNKQNINYLRKDGDIIEEIGEPPVEGNVRMASDLIGLPQAEVRIHEVSSWLKMNSATHLTKEDIYKPEIEVLYIWSSISGVGKTKYVFDHIEGEFDRVKYMNGFWLGIPPSGTAETAWYDDFRGDMPAHEFISFIDYYVNQLNCKGFSTPNKYKKIFITSALNVLMDIKNELISC